MRWVMLGALCGVYFAFGVMLLAIPPMVTEVRADLDVSRRALGFALGAWALLYVFTAPPAGRIVDRLGLRWSLSIGSLLIATSAAVQATAQNLTMLWLAIGILGVGGPLVSLSAPKLVAVWFVDAGERPMAVGLYTSAPALGGVAALLMTNTVLLPALGDWRSVLLAEAALNLGAGAVWLVVSGRVARAGDGDGDGDGDRDGDRDRDRDGVGLPQVVPATGRGQARTLLTSPGMRLAIVLGIGSFFITQGMAAWLPNMLVEHIGLSTGAASNWAAGSLAVGIVARLVVPGLARPQQRSMVLHGTMTALVAGMLVLAFGPTWLALPAAIVLGLRATLNSLVIVVLMDAELVTPANTGLAYGLWFSAVEVGGAAGPPVVGAFGDSERGFPAALVAMSVLLVAMMAVLWADDRRRRQRPALDQIACDGPALTSDQRPV
jgi:cyanate permease